MPAVSQVEPVDKTLVKTNEKTKSHRPCKRGPCSVPPLELYPVFWDKLLEISVVHALQFIYAVPAITFMGTNYCSAK